MESGCLGMQPKVGGKLHLRQILCELEFFIYSLCKYILRSRDIYIYIYIYIYITIYSRQVTDLLGGGHIHISTDNSTIFKQI